HLAATLAPLLFRCYSSRSVFSLRIRPPPSSTLFPYTTLFRSLHPRPDLRGLRADHLRQRVDGPDRGHLRAVRLPGRPGADQLKVDRKSTRLNSSHVKISYAVFCLKKKKRYKSERTR